MKHLSLLNLACGLVWLVLSTGPAQAQTIPNPSFEENTFTNAPGYASANGGAISGWTIDGTWFAGDPFISPIVPPSEMVGLNPAGGNPFADNGAVPDGINVAFLQSDSNLVRTLYTTITGLVPGSDYEVSFRANSRAATGPPNPMWSVNGPITFFNNPTATNFVASPSVGGANGYYTNRVVFTATNTTARLMVGNRTSYNSTVLVDDFRIAEIPHIPHWTLSPWTDDLSTGFSPRKTLWAYHFNSSAFIPINGLGVIGVTGANPAVEGRFAISGMGNTYDNHVNNLTPLSGLASSVMAKSFIYGGNPATITVEGLTVGESYVVTLFGVAFDGPGKSVQLFASEGDERVMDEDVFGLGNGMRVDYEFTAMASTRAITITPADGVSTFHLYGVALRAPSPLVLNGPSVLTNECHRSYTELGAAAGQSVSRPETPTA